MNDRLLQQRAQHSACRRASAGGRAPRERIARRPSCLELCTESSCSRAAIGGLPPRDPCEDPMGKHNVRAIIELTDVDVLEQLGRKGGTDGNR